VNETECWLVLLRVLAVSAVVFVSSTGVSVQTASTPLWRTRSLGPCLRCTVSTDCCLWCRRPCQSRQEARGNPVSRFQYCPSNGMRSIGQNIESLACLVSVHPSGVCGQDCDVFYAPIFTPNLEHSFPVASRRKDFFSSSIRSCIRACATINRLPLTTFVETINTVFTKWICFCVGYFNKLAELIFVTVFNMCVCRKKLTKRQKFEKTSKSLAQG